MSLDPIQIRRRQEKGGILVLVSVGMIGLLAFASLSLNISHLFQEQRDVQSATDAGALAGAALLITDSGTSSPIVTEAQRIAQANGITANEITASGTGVIQAGQWDGTTFTAGPAPYNAVRVPAKRNVGFFFGSLLGVTQKFTEVHSVAALTGVGSATDFIPFGVDKSAVQGLGYGDQFTIGGKAAPGNWGKINPNDAYQNSNSWSDDMTTDGYNGVMAIGDTIDTITGVAKEANAWSSLINQTVVIVIADQFENGSGSIKVDGFAVVKIIAASGNGNNLQVTFQLEPGVINGTGGVASATPFASARVLVQ